MKNNSQISLADTIGGTVTISQAGPRYWKIRQRIIAGGEDNVQNPTWLRIENPGGSTILKVEVVWADFKWQNYRRCGYQKIGEQYVRILGDAGYKSTVYKLKIPAGTSYFGTFPWYTNEDGESFMNGLSTHPLCAIRSIGRTGQGREINCLTIGGRKIQGRKPNVVVTGRMHATESAGSYAVEGVARFLLNDRKGKALLNKYTFHLFTIVNPDGVDAGIKLTQSGSKKEYDMDLAGMVSLDPTITALRNEIKKLKPACLIDHHSYLWALPALFFYDKKTGAILYDELYGRNGPETAFYYRLCDPRRKITASSLRAYCYLHYQTTAVIAELPWNWDNLPDDMRKWGVDILAAVIKAHIGKKR